MKSLEALKRELEKVISQRNKSRIELLMAKIELKEAEEILEAFNFKDQDFIQFINKQKGLVQYSELLINTAYEMDIEGLENQIFDLLEGEKNISKFKRVRNLYRLNKLAFLMLEKELFSENINRLFQS
ncbi:hypothetical protein ACPX19_01375 [Winogradskyella sp. HB-48]|uniref:hypothetical protein n=1 Tax=Winogradskyella sp. HB-48 TaxID=3416808 RepID=UPI003CEC6299